MDARTRTGEEMETAMATETINQTVDRVWSEFQKAIFDEFATGSRNVQVIARAGTGKTTTIMAGVAYAPESSILVAAFSKSIEIELNKRIAELQLKNVVAKTLHALGYACIRRFWTDIRLGQGTDRVDDLVNRACGNAAPDTIKKLVAKLCTKAREMAPHATKMGELTDIAIRFECEPEEGWAADGFGLEYVEEMALRTLVLAEEKPVRTGIDFSDMIFLPVRLRWLRPAYQLVVIDEAQDMTETQLEIARGVCSGRVFVVGDDMQSIFQFRGADENSMENLRRGLNAFVLPLKVTYRCGKSIVREAQKFVPDFVAGENNPEGEVIDLPEQKLTETAGPGDFILSRTNAPLVSVAMSLLRAGKRTRVAGKDIGKGLISLVRKLKGRSVPDLLSKLSAWQERETLRLEKRFAGKLDSATFVARCEAIRDQAEMIASLTDGAKNVDEVSVRIEALFTDDGLGQDGVITCSSVHRAKGLEAKRVFVIAKTLRETTQEERNICYVAITRAKQTLVYVR
jgi:superfamily I DNA/RNA helicase